MLLLLVRGRAAGHLRPSEQITENLRANVCC